MERGKIFEPITAIKEEVVMVQRFWPAFMMVLVGAFVLGFGGALLLRADGGGSDSSQTDRKSVV